MSRSNAIAGLRARIARQERAAVPAWPVAGLGPVTLDCALPRGGLATGALYEIMPGGSGHSSAALGFGLGLLARILKARPGHILWALPSWQGFAEGMLHPAGLASFGIDPARLIHVGVPKPQNVLWTLDEALAHKSVTAAVGLLPPSDRAYGFTASRRLSMRAARHGATALILAGKPDIAMATASAMRWSVRAEPSLPARRTGQAIPGLGAPRWHVRLIKSRHGGAGQWHLEWDHETLSFRLAAPLADRAPFGRSGHQPGQWIAA